MNKAVFCPAQPIGAESPDSAAVTVKIKTVFKNMQLHPKIPA